MPNIKKTLLIFIISICMMASNEWNINAKAASAIEKKEEIKRMNQKIYETYQRLLKVEQNINSLQMEIYQLQTNLQRLKEKLLLLKRRNGDYLSIETVLGIDPLSHVKMDSIGTIVEADIELIEEKQELQNQKQQLEQRMKRLNHLIVEQKRLNNLLLKETIHPSEQQTGSIVSSEEDIPAMKMIDSIHIQKIITSGYQYIGNSVYVFGGGRSPEDIRKGRFDCSSFVQWAFRQAGIEIGSTTNILKNEGRQISVSEMKPGDLVFFDTYKKDGHVGIYMGNQRFIGSQSSTGVAVADMSFGYWKDKFNGRVVRIIE